MQKIMTNNEFEIFLEKKYEEFKDKHWNVLVNHDIHKTAQINCEPILKKSVKSGRSLITILIKFRYSEKATKIGPSSTYNLMLLSNVKKEGKMGLIFLAFSEYLNFNIFTLLHT